MNKELDDREEPINETSRDVARILLAEDSRINQKVVCIILEKAGFSVDVVGNGLKVMEAVESGSYDLILMDCMMPGMNGYDATAAIRKMDGVISGIPIIALTANTTKRDRVRCIKAGMDDYLVKPLDKPVILKTIKKWIHQPEKVGFRIMRSGT